MSKSTFRLFSAVLLGALAYAPAQESDIELKRVSIVGQFDNGQIVSGRINQYDNSAFVDPSIGYTYKFNGDFFQRTSVWITQEAVVAERLRLVMGVGGIFWYALPTSSNINTRITQFGPGISQAQGTYTFGDLADPAATLQMGYFPYKYNPDAKNLGEYLMRSGTYPGYLVTGGWNMLNSAAFMMQGLRANFSLWDGKFQSDVLLAMENSLPPMFSISPAYVATVKPTNGIQVGAGIACNHCLPIKPSRESPKVGTNMVIESATYDTTLGAYVYEKDSSSFYTFQGIKVSANASVDPKAFVPMPFLGPEDLKLYGEIAVLGWKNYSYMYEKRTERMPIMVGLNLPAFKLLDVLALEVEYYNSPWINSFYSQYRGAGLPIPMIPGIDQDGTADQATVDQYASDVRRDNWKWSLFARKQVVKGIEIYAQAASDHIRTINAEAGPMPAMTPITNRNGKEWYYIVRLQFGI
jgi:hypothetical protein